MAIANDKKYLVKMYRDGAFQGVLPYVVTDFNYSQDINTAGCDITVQLATDLKGAGISVDVDYLITNTGNHITDDNGNRIITRKDYMFTTVPVDIGNQADIWLYYSGALNGVRVFSGIVSSWESDESDGTITMTALSYGVQLDNYPIQVLPGSDIVSQLKTDSAISLYSNIDKGYSTFNHTIILGQTFQVPTNNTISAITLTIAKSSWTGVEGATLSMYTGAPDTGILISSVSHAITNTSASEVTFTLPSAIPVITGTTYSFTLKADYLPTDYYMSVSMIAAGAYANGQSYTYNDTAAAWTAGTPDLYFRITTSSGAIGNQFLSQDPGDIIVGLLDSFTDAGGVVNCDETSVGATGTIVSYTFKSNTVLDGVKKCLELAPPNWYWYVDVGSNILYFQQFSLNADHTFVKGLQVETLKTKYTLEQMKNKVLFTGGDPGTGTNITSTQSNDASISKYGQWLDTDSDTRVTTQTTADVLASNLLGEYSRPNFQTTCTVLASAYDIETLELGQMVTFRNYDVLTNSLILQIVTLSRTPDKAILTLATLPPTQAHRIEDIKRNLDAVITQNNPAD